MNMPYPGLRTALPPGRAERIPPTNPSFADVGIYPVRPLCGVHIAVEGGAPHAHREGLRATGAQCHEAAGLSRIHNR